MPLGQTNVNTMKRTLHWRLKRPGQGHIARVLEIYIRSARTTKIDRYLQLYKTIDYLYDFSDYWQHSIETEKIIDDYELIYPVCIK